MRCSRLLPLTLATLVLVVPFPLAGQDSLAFRPPGVDLRGQVVEEDTGAPVVNVLVLLDGAGRTLSGPGGRFVIRGVVPGPHALRVEMIGYTSLEWGGEVTFPHPEIRFRLPVQAVVLKGLRVTADRLEARRRASPHAVHVLDEDDLLWANGDGLRALAQGGVSLVQCPPSVSRRREGRCVYRRGSFVEPSVFIDDNLRSGGLQALGQMTPGELILMEIYQHGQAIRAYTRRYVEWLASSGIHPPAFR